MGVINSVNPMSPQRTCPICKRPIQEGEAALRFRPFCSKRCADIDLGRWLKGTYAIPAVEADESETEAPAEDSDEFQAGGNPPRH